jgi:hypothetical protein
MPMDRLNFLKELASHGISFHVDIPDIGGVKGIYIRDVKEILEYLENPDLFAAREYGVSLKDYLLWRSDDYCVICMGKTQKRKRCKKVVTGGSGVCAQKWVSLQGE